MCIILVSQAMRFWIIMRELNKRIIYVNMNYYDVQFNPMWKFFLQYRLLTNLLRSTIYHQWQRSRLIPTSDELWSCQVQESVWNGQLKADFYNFNFNLHLLFLVLIRHQANPVYLLELKVLHLLNVLLVAKYSVHHDMHPFAFCLQHLQPKLDHLYSRNNSSSKIEEIFVLQRPKDLMYILIHYYLKLICVN